MSNELLTIQQELRAPKGQRNSFGNYNYRSCEDILTAVKPLLAKTKTTLTISDEVVAVGNRNYVKSMVTLKDSTGNVIAGADGWACESETKKGMDSAQITGACSSYARKYALNGLFAIDDTKDADTMDNSESAPKVMTTQQPQQMEGNW